MGYPNLPGGTLGLACFCCRPKSRVRSWVLAHFPCKCWLTWRPFSSATHGVGWLQVGMPVEGTACLVVTPQALQGWGSPLRGLKAGM